MGDEACERDSRTWEASNPFGMGHRLDGPEISLSEVITLCPLARAEEAEQPTRGESQTTGDILFTSGDVLAMLGEAARRVKRGEPCPSIHEICRSLEGAGWRPNRMPGGLPND